MSKIAEEFTFLCAELMAGISADHTLWEALRLHKKAERLISNKDLLTNTFAHAAARVTTMHDVVPPHLLPRYEAWAFDKHENLCELFDSQCKEIRAILDKPLFAVSSLAQDTNLARQFTRVALLSVNNTTRNIGALGDLFTEQLVALADTRPSTRDIEGDNCWIIINGLGKSVEKAIQIKPKIKPPKYLPNF